MESDLIEEVDALPLISKVTHPEVYHFLKFYPSELSSKDLSVHKTSKAHSYFKDGWLQQLQFHNVSEGSDYLILKGKM